jgi:hypothetical protein
MALLSPSVLSRNLATSWGPLLEIKPASTRNCMPLSSVRVGASNLQRATAPRTFFGFWLNRLIPSIKVVFFCLALSNLLGSSTMSGVVPLATSGSGSRSSDADASGMGALLLGSSDDVLFPVPQATRERRMEARHSSPCRRSCASDWPSAAGSTACGVLRAVVLRDGATFAFCSFVDCCGMWLAAASAFFWPAMVVCVLLLLSFVMTLTRLGKSVRTGLSAR